MLHCWSSITVFDVVWFVGFIYLDVWKFVLWSIILVKAHDAKSNATNDAKSAANADADGSAAAAISRQRSTYDWYQWWHVVRTQDFRRKSVLLQCKNQGVCLGETQKPCYSTCAKSTACPIWTADIAASSSKLPLLIKSRDCPSLSFNGLFVVSSAFIQCHFNLKIKLVIILTDSCTYHHLLDKKIWFFIGIKPSNW